MLYVLPKLQQNSENCHLAWCVCNKVITIQTLSPLYLKVKCGDTTAFYSLPPPPPIPISFFSIENTFSAAYRKDEYVCTRSRQSQHTSRPTHNSQALPTPPWKVPDQCPSTPSTGKRSHLCLQKKLHFCWLYNFWPAYKNDNLSHVRQLWKVAEGETQKQ